MDPSQRLDALLAPLRDDVVSGATEVARTASEILAQAAEGIHAESLPELRAALAHTGVRILDAQPAMAPLVALVSSVLRALEPASDVHEGRLAARTAAHDFGAGLEERAGRIAHRAAGELPADGRVLTLSSSATVLQAVIHAGARRPREVVVLESRPVREGREAARALLRAGVPVTFAVDAAAAAMVADVDLVLLGADSVGDRGCVNKLGSLPLALAAREAGVPVLVACDSTKILPHGFPQPLTDDRPPAQVWQAPEGVRVWNRYFEAVPLPLVASVVTDAAVLDPEGIREARDTLSVPEELAAWARDQAPEAPDRGPSW